MTLTRILLVCLYTCALLVAGEAACPFKCYCEEKEVKCSANMDEEFPVFPPDTEKIELSQLNVRYIPVNAFKHLPGLKSIHITNSNIAEFQSCSVAGLQNLTRIIVDKSAIGNIESYAFRDLSNIGEIRLENCRIGRIKPFAFYNIANITLWNMINVHMRNIYSESFYKVAHIENIVFHKSNFSDVVTNAFEQLSNVTNFEAHRNKFWNMHCKNLDDLMNAVTGKFYFSQNTFYCNCSISWLRNDVGRAKYGSLLTENSCHGPDNYNQTKLDNLLDLKCPDSRQKCKEVERLNPKPKCPLPGQASPDVVAENKKDLKDKEKNGANNLQLMRLLSLTGLTSILLF